jgi:cell division protein FtsA
MGRTTAGLAVYRDGRLLDTRCFPWGSYQITRDVAAGLRISFEEADELVLQYGIALELIEEDFGQENDGAAEEEAGDSEAGGRGESPGLKLRSAVPGAPSIAVRREFDTIVYDRAKELMTMVRQHIKSQDLSRSLIRGVVLTGGASAIQHYDRLAEAVFQTPCRLGRPLPAPGYPSLNDPSLSAAAGLLRHAFEHRAAVREGRLGDSSALPKWMQRLGGVFRRFFL